jgi:protein tyrosine/serine phosphatase
VHCKSGADRAGLFAALILLHREGATVAEARRQLSLRFGHVRLARTGILDAFLEAYEEQGERNGLSLRQWTEQRYDPSELAARFRPRFWPTILIDRIMRRE